MNETIFFLIELRKRLLRALLITGLVWLILSFFANNIYYFIALPFLHRVTAANGLIATSVTASFLIPFKCAFIISLFLTMPFWLYQIWQFVFPALYKGERQFVRTLFFTSIALFYGGVLFAYWVVLPLLLKFFLYTAPQGVDVRPDISQYFDFVTRTFISFGLCFELPILIVILVLTGMVTYDNLIKIRPYAIVGAFVVGMLLTSPDVISQTLLALPLWGLFECGLLLAKWALKKQDSH